MAKTIAVFDDDTDFLDLMRDVLTGAGYRVVAETSADEALAIALRERPALVILDFWMAGRGAGLTALRLIRDHPETAALPVLICSADRTALNDYADDWRALGCETLEKPFDLGEMLAEVVRLAGTEGAPRLSGSGGIYVGHDTRKPGASQRTLMTSVRDSHHFGRNDPAPVTAGAGYGEYAISRQGRDRRGRGSASPPPCPPSLRG